MRKTLEEEEEVRLNYVFTIYLELCATRVGNNIQIQCSGVGSQGHPADGF